MADFIPELVAPAGSYEALWAAVENGADAVYLAGKKFGARHYAENFTNDEMLKALGYAHSRGVRIYVTVNTLVKESELDDLREYLDFLFSSEADAVIIQDLGALHMLREEFSQLRVHASTQMNVHNAGGINFLERFGVKRVVLSRELSVDDIKSISECVNMELEVFVHGALCYSYSGACVFSSMLSGRSANRGRCAQGCRREYTAVRGRQNKELQTGYLLSMKDLCGAELLPDLALAGVSALKIEGRMKRPEYVASVVGIYRTLLERLREDNFYVSVEEKKELLQIFNRGFTAGYLTDKKRNMVNPLACGNAGIEIGHITKRDGNTIVVRLTGGLRAGDGIEIPLLGRSIGRSVDFDAKRGGTINLELKNASGVLVGGTVYKTSDIDLLKRLRRTFDGSSSDS